MTDTRDMDWPTIMAAAARRLQAIEARTGTSAPGPGLNHPIHYEDRQGVHVDTSVWAGPFDTLTDVLDMAERHLADVAVPGTVTVGRGRAR
jgi:hypothetical protein